MVITVLTYIFRVLRALPQIEEHYTDTAGYTDQVFGLFHLFGIRFAPRIRDLSECVLFSFNDTEEFYKTIKDIVKGRINVKSITDDYESVLKLAHSIFIGKVSASLILEKLGSYSRKNSMAKALRVFLPIPPKRWNREII